MWSYVWDNFCRVIGNLMRVLDRFDSTQWIYLFIGVTVLGVICMRGYKSRL